QREVGALRIVEAIEAEVGVPAILDGLGVARLERQRAVVGRQRRVVLAELAIGVTHVVPGFVHRRIELGGAREFPERAGVAVLGLVERLGLFLGIRLVRRISGEAVGLLDDFDAGFVRAARLLFGRRWRRRGATHRTARHFTAARPESGTGGGEQQDEAQGT